jgi:hypothetical protein
METKAAFNYVGWGRFLGKTEQPEGNYLSYLWEVIAFIRERTSGSAVL